MPKGQAGVNMERPRASTTSAAQARAFPHLQSRKPAVRKGFVRRTALARRLVEAASAQLALIVAPAGYGKSSLLVEWAERDEREFVWLALSTDDDDAGRIALERQIESRRSGDHSQVIVLDDAHRLRPTVLRALVDTGLAGLPPGSTLAIASRAEPALPIGRLRANRALVEVRTCDLVMTPAEASTLLRRAGLELDLEAVQTLVKRTEGWPAGLYLAALSLRQEDDLPAAVARFGGDDHLLAEFLKDEVLSVLKPDLRSFSIRTSALEVLSGPVCNAVLDSRGSALALAELAQQTEFLVPLDPAHEEYRWHGLVRDTFQAELRRKEPELEPRVQRKASAWYRGVGDIDAAIEHAVAAGDVRHAGELLWSNILAYVTRGRHETVQRWLRGFTTEQIAECPALALSAAHSFLVSGGAAEAQHWALLAAGACERQHAGTVAQTLWTGIAAIDATAARDGAVGMGALADRACELEAGDSSWRGLLCLLQGVSRHLAGDRSSAKKLLDESAHLSSVTQPVVHALALAQTIVISIEEQDWELAGELAERATAVLEEPLLAECPICAFVFAAVAAVRAHQGSVDEAKQDLRCGIELLATLGDFIPWYGAETRILLAHASLWLADIVGARTLLAEASRLARRTPDAIIFQRWFDEAWAYMDTLAETRLAGPSSLTIAELRILRFLPSHRSFREIAEQIGVSANTVKTQAHAVYRKLGAVSRSEAVARARDAGLLGQ
jgi:LuxR family maltose regulon positive regulatory protein